VKSITDLLGMDLLIIQAPMAGVQGRALAIAVSNAGGLGSLPCAMLSPEAMREELATVANGTRKSYNVNFFCRTPSGPEVEREAAWRAVLQPYYDELAIESNLRFVQDHPLGHASVHTAGCVARPLQGRADLHAVGRHRGDQGADSRR
jgi:NAD(P)H-dependent flavin oxidoreductase YrpB (nitropropane dioxygenase family)